MKAFNYIKSHKNIESVLEVVEIENEKRKKKFQVPDNFLYKESRGLFKIPDVLAGEEVKLKWDPPNEEGLKQFLQEDKGFSETTVNNALAKFKKCKGKANQQRLDSFFKVGVKK